MATIKVNVCRFGGLSLGWLVSLPVQTLHEEVRDSIAKSSYDKQGYNEPAPSL